MQKVNEQPLETYAHWIDSGRIIVPCLKGKPIVKNWQAPTFKISKEEWKRKHEDCAIGLRLDDLIDFDVDNELVKKFINKYLSLIVQYLVDPQILQAITGGRES